MKHTFEVGAPDHIFEAIESLADYTDAYFKGDPEGDFHTISVLQKHDCGKVDYLVYLGADPDGTRYAVQLTKDSDGCMWLDSEEWDMPLPDPKFTTFGTLVFDDSPNEEA